MVHPTQAGIEADERVLEREELSSNVRTAVTYVGRMLLRAERGGGFAPNNGGDVRGTNAVANGKTSHRERRWQGRCCAIRCALHASGCPRYRLQQKRLLAAVRDEARMRRQRESRQKGQKEL